MGTERRVYWWDGTDKSTAVPFANNTTAFNYGLAGLVRPTASISSELNDHAGTAKYGGRQEAGRYYYMYTYFDEARQVESLPSTVIDYTTTSWEWNATRESSKFPVITVTPATHTAPSDTSGRYDTNTKVRVYRTRRSNSGAGVINPPNKFYFIGEVDYAAAVASVAYTHATRKLVKTGAFANASAGDFIALSGGTSVASKAYRIESKTNDNEVVLVSDGETYTNDTVTVNLMAMPDYAHDKELVEEYEGRGSPPPAGVDYLASFANRMYYFVGNTVYWSSAGRPEEVAQKFSLNYDLESDSGVQTTSSLEFVPLLSTGGNGEAKYEISELAGETVMAAYPLKNRLYIWTKEGTSGYLEGTYTTEGVRFFLLRKGIGVVSSKTISHTPYGIFGADRDGIWQLDGAGSLLRISKGVIDFADTTKDTYANQSYLEHSFGFWAYDLDEYVFCAVNLGINSYCAQVGYSPMRQVFSASYKYPALFGGCQLITSTGSQNYLTGGKTFDTTSAEALGQVLDFWMGQGSLETVKENVGVEIIYESITADKNVAVDVYQNNIASTTGAAAFTGTVHNDDNLVGVVRPHSSGRMFLIRITVPSDCHAPILAVNYIADFVPWNEKKQR
jgi:hypothetical protein